MYKEHKGIRAKKSIIISIIIIKISILTDCRSSEDDSQGLVSKGSG